LRARTLAALGLMMVALACAPAIAAAATGGAGMTTKSSPARSAAGEIPTPAPAPAPTTQDQAGGAAFGSVPALLHPTVPGDVGVIRDGIAYAPAAAPLQVQQAIWAANTLRHKPYIFGGGHNETFRGRGYDCSGTVSFALHAAGLLDSPLDSSSFMGWGERGRGQWITVYTNPGHAFAIIAGMRLDTSGVGESGPRWRTEPRSTRGFKVRHPEFF
jgi:cell wall-associated NlpC family hydrolase